MHYVIIGVGSAGTNAAETIREHDPNGKITVISDEGVPYYVREHLNRLIEGSETEQDLYEKGYDFFDKINAEFVSGKVIELEEKNDLIILENNEKIHYDKLLIASGGKPINLNIKGKELNGITTLYSMKDAKYVLKQLPYVKNIVFIGGGSIALKIAPILNKMGKNITIIEKEAIMMSKMLDYEGSMLLKKKIEKTGISVITSEEVVEFKGNNMKIEQIILKSGKIIPADLAISIVGIKPSIDFLKNTSLKIDRGIIVDLFMKTNIENIYAAGDVAYVPDPIHNFKALPHPGWGEAKDQGKNAGLNMVRNNTQYPGEIRLNRMKFKKYAFISGGLMDAKNGYEVSVESGNEFYKKFIFDKNRLIGAIVLMKDFDSKKWKKWLKKQFFNKNPTLETKNAIFGMNFHD